MSPSEKDLRAALRHGEGDGLDVGQIIQRSQQARARRRTQLLSGASAAVLVAGIGAGAWALGRAGGGTSSAGGSSGQDSRLGPRAAGPAAGGASAGGASAGGGSAPATASAPASATAPGAASAPAGGAAAGAGCPSSLPRYVLPPAGSSSGAPLFTGPVSSVVVCDYGPTSQALGAKPPAPARTVLRGADAAALVDSLDRTSARKPVGMCPQYRLATERQLAIRGLSADGQSLGLVTTVLGRPSCATDVRNGKTVRYDWNPPESFVKAIPGGGYSHQPVLQSVPPS